MAYGLWLEALSKGNQQKVQFAAAVLHRPRVAVLDEPFSGLDPLNQEAMLEIIGELREAGATIVLSAHQLNLVERLADRMLLMANGRALLQGTLAEVRGAADPATTLVIETTGVGDISALAGDPDVIDARAEPGRVVLLTRRGADLGRLLTQAAARLPIQAVRSEAMTLHDVYVRAVRRASPGHEATP